MYRNVFSCPDLNNEIAHHRLIILQEIRNQNYNHLTYYFSQLINFIGCTIYYEQSILAIDNYKVLAILFNHQSINSNMINRFEYF